MSYRIRLAKPDDRNQIHHMIRESVANEKKCLDPALVQADFINEYVDKVIAKGNMLVVENSQMELEMFGEIHDYNLLENAAFVLKEFSFVSGKASSPLSGDTDIVTWLFSEIQNNHKDVFRVEMKSPVSSSSRVDYFRSLGMVVEGSYNGRLKNITGDHFPIIPLSWINPSFN